MIEWQSQYGRQQIATLFIAAIIIEFFIPKEIKFFVVTINYENNSCLAAGEYVMSFWFGQILLMANSSNGQKRFE